MKKYFLNFIIILAFNVGFSQEMNQQKSNKWSIEKAKKLLNYDPKFDINAGIKEAVTWYWNHLK